MIINKGNSDGIEANMAGDYFNWIDWKSKNSRQFTSTVQLLSSNDPTNRVSAEILGGKQDLLWSD